MQLNREKAVRIMSLMDELRAELVGTFISVEGSTTAAEVEEVIEFEGKKYQKVDRKAKEGDVVILKKGIDEVRWLTIGKPYKVHTNNKSDSEIFGDDGDSIVLYRSDSFNRTTETVDTYELIKEEVKQEQPKFKIGDKVEIVKEHFMFNVGEIVEVNEVFNDSFNTVLTKNRVSKSNHHFHRGDSIRINNDIAEKVKSPNQQRKEVIEKAKQYIENTKTDVSGPDTTTGQLVSFKSVYKFYENGPFTITACRVEFIVNDEKSTVVALLKPIKSNRIVNRGIAKCNPSDVFNADIGKAIALGRALGLDVSEFEKAVQPTEFSNGQIVTFPKDHSWYCKYYYRIDDINSKTNNLTKLFDNGSKANANFKDAARRLVITDDTNAQY